jgi:Zn-dependent protease
MGNVMQYVYIIIVELLSLSFHECAHAFVSYKLGDPTAKNVGRLTLNPLKHLDILGTIMMVATLMSGTGFGWAKPVPINPMYYKNKKTGTMLVSIAGPLSNLLLAFISILPIIYIGSKYDTTILNASDPKIMLMTFLQMFVKTNIVLAIFNLLPVPPLDGSKILSGILPSRQYYKFMEYENYIGIAFLLIIFIFPGPFSTVLRAITTPVLSLLVDIAVPIVRLFL